MKNRALVDAMSAFVFRGCRGRKYRMIRRLNVAYAMGWNGEDVGRMAGKRSYRSAFEAGRSTRRKIDSMPKLSEEERYALALKARIAMAGLVRDRSWAWSGR